jgi:hypothetical protein
MRIILLTLIFAVSVFAEPIHTTYLWHLEQPVYWPDATTYGAGYETAWESIQRRDGGAAHPENDVAQIFSVADRVAAYQGRPYDAILTMTGADAGAQVTFSGGLLRNVMSLGAHNSYGYSPGWNAAFQAGRNLLTSGGHSRLEMTIIPYHHSLAPLVDREVLKKDIQIYQEAYASAWGASPAQSTGFFPPELAFSERIIPVLEECGISWSFVPSNHLSRACENFPLILGTGGENCDPPNRADQINPSSANWHSQTISRGCTPTDAVPFGFQPHYAEHINPETGTASRVIVVPIAMAMSWQDGSQIYSTGDINSIESFNDPAHPMLISLGHDGDNFFGGGYSYYMESVSGFTAAAVNDGYEPTTVPEFLADHPPLISDLVHVEDGAWVNADGDFGHPDFINWNWPLYDSGGNSSVENGWAEDARNWAVITAATNRVVTAEQVAGAPTLAAVWNPRTSSPSTVDLAWHFLLGALNSGFMYYGTALDMEVKPAVACNEAVYHADQIIAGQADNTPPTVWALQQLPHNPGAIGFGPTFGYQQVQNPRDFYVWTFAYDVSGIASCSLRYRLDLNGENPLSSTQNETFAGGGEVTNWRSRAMTFRNFPAGNVYNNPSIDFFEMPDYIADQYYYHLTDGEVADSGGVLVDYYVEAVDNDGNVKRTDIYHTFVGTGEGGGPGNERVWMIPDTAVTGEIAAIYYDPTGGPIGGANPIYIHVGHSGWQGVITPDPVMSWNVTEEAWQYNYSVPLGAASINVVFHDGSGNWDNNNGQDWQLPVTAGGSGGNEFVMDGELDDDAEVIAARAVLTLLGDWNGSELYVATERASSTGHDRFIFIADSPENMVSAPWGKSGQVANWSAYLAEEADNGWMGWFNYEGVVASAGGAFLEGTINLLQEIGPDVASVWICCGLYDSPDGGALQFQLPFPVVDNGDLEASEWIELQLKPDSLTITLSDGSIELNWTPAFGANGYRVYRYTDINGTPDIFAAADTTYTELVTSDRAFFEVRASFD